MRIRQMRGSLDELNAGSLNFAAAKKRSRREPRPSKFDTDNVGIGELLVKFRQSARNIGRLINLFDNE